MTKNYFLIPENKLPQDSEGSIYEMIRSKAGIQKKMPEYLDKYLDKNIDNKNFPKHLKAYFTHVCTKVDQKELGNKYRMSKETLLKIFGKRKGVNSGVPIEYLDIVCMYAYDDLDATFFRKFGITKVEDLKPYCIQKAWEEVRKLNNLGLLYIKYDSMDQDWKNEINQIESSHNTEISKEETKPIKENIEKDMVSENTEFFNSEVNTSRRRITVYKSLNIWVVIVAVLISCGGGGFFYWKNTNHKWNYTCYKDQKTAKSVGEKTAAIRILVLPFKKGKQEIERFPECILYGKIQEFIADISYIDKDNISPENIETIFGSDENYDWKENYRSNDLVFEIAKDYNADYVVWGEYVRESMIEINKSTFSIRGLWTGNRVGVSSKELTQYLDTVSAQKILTPLAFMNSDLGGLIENTVDNENANFHTIGDIHSKHLETHFRFMLYYFFVKNKQYKEAYEVLDPLNSTKAIQMQVEIARNDILYLEPILEKAEQKLKNEQINVRSYSLMKIICGLHMWIFIDKIRLGGRHSEWKYALDRAHFLAEKCISFTDNYYSSFHDYGKLFASEKKLRFSIFLFYQGTL